MPRPLTIDDKFDRFPPVVTRLLARERIGGATIALLTPRVSILSRLSIGEVNQISKLTSWDTVDFGTWRAFCAGCRADFDSRDWLRKNAAYMNSVSSIPRYLLQSAEWSTTFEPLIRIWLRHEQAKAA